MLRKLVATALLLFAVVETSACGGAKGSSGTKPDAKNTPEVDRFDTIPVELTVRLRGDVNLTMEKRSLTSVFVVRRSPMAGQEMSQIMGVENVEPVDAGGMLIKTGIAVVPFKGGGDYTFRPGSASDGVREEEEAKRTGTPRELSSVKVEWWPTTDINGQIFLFQRREKECKATVEEDGTRGRVSCPVVTDEARSKRFSFEFEWDVP